ncbi:MAG: tRNA (guanosine(46)-N7)-methyltransferase TrmB [Prevotellaceae bacterium]|jgi:tRNA (guanine-N7-)-methyltransferase|nr:tRNA (guanosine(46)-N7)-methyltransferase TrmB [Prevotellaceae bacterium]
MSGKDKLRKFKENTAFTSLHQPEFDAIFKNDYELKGKWNTNVFKNSNPIILELGCGKGEYTVALSLKFPNKNFIGIDIKGARLWKGAKFAHENKLENVAFIRTRIDFITSFFAENEISEIWITFADPQLKRSRKRLTGIMFLNRYRHFLKSEGIIHLKTDSRFLHEYTLALSKQNNLKIIEANNDIYGSNRADDILSIKTFYEQQFLEQGFPITYLAFCLNNVSTLKEPVWEKDKYTR